MILSEIGFIEKYLKGWTITILGSKNGGIQKENNQNGMNQFLKFVLLHLSLKKLKVKQEKVHRKKLMILKILTLEKNL